MARLTSAAVLLGSLVVLSGCGVKGPLYLPPEPASQSTAETENTVSQKASPSKNQTSPGNSETEANQTQLDTSGEQAGGSANSKANDTQVQETQ